MNKNQFAYRLAPWRKQVKTILNFVLAAAAAATVAMVYLSISANMTDAKLQIQVLQDKRGEVSRQIAELTTDEGMLTAYNNMLRRAQEAGFVDIDFDNEDIYSFMVIDGYNGTGINTDIHSPAISVISESLIKPEYSQSLQSWLADRIAIGIKSNESQY